MRPITRIIIHCSATLPGQACNAAIIDRWHRSQGYTKIGYHYVVNTDGTIERGRDESEVGAHCLGKNTGSIGICYVGGLDSQARPKDTRTNEQKRALRDLIRSICQRYKITDIAGHNEFSAKACPCFNVKLEGYGR